MSNETVLLDGSMETSLTRTIKLVVFAVPLGPSLLCSLYIIICIVSQANQRRRANHSMIAIIFIDLLELICDLIAITLPYLSIGYVHHLSICLYWVTGNYTLQGIAAWLMAWASIDRYLLIFHHRLRTTFIRHDLSILIIVTFIVTWYTIITFTHPCTKDWFDGRHFLCGGPCFNTSAITATADWMLIVLIPALLIILVNLLLLGRVLHQKCRHRPGFGQNQLTWRKTRKLLVQLLGIILIFLITQIPLVILSLIQIFFFSDFLVDISHLWLYYMPYLIYIITPFVYLTTTKDCRTRWFQRHHRIAVMPARLPHRQGETHNTARDLIIEEHLNRIQRTTPLPTSESPAE